MKSDIRLNLSQLLEFIDDPTLADIIFQRVGGNARGIKTINDHISAASHFYIRCILPEAKIIIKTINWNYIKFNTAGNPSISRSDIIREYSNRKKELVYIGKDFYITMTHLVL